MTPEAVIDEVAKSGLRGRGGAGFPTGMKWKFARTASGSPKYLVCNADEGDPGAFMDRSVLEGDPHAVLEGMLIAAYAIGANQGFIYARSEYPLAIQLIERAIGQMREHGLLGEQILGSDFSFDIAVKEGAGAFVCGEETALIASIEGKRGMPKPRPPFPANSGLWGKPTNINNVETYANVAAILVHGAEWYAGYGGGKNTGTKTFSLTGKVKRSGLIEVPLGMPLQDVIFDVGVAGVHRLLAHRDLLEDAHVVIAVAGMEGALPSIVAGLVSTPVVAVPTSVGYGATFEGLSALLTMITSCAPGIGVVNIDNGFGAATLASRINRLGSAEGDAAGGAGA
jgi:NADH:ubiquinone oxidoreductase subunit F (NADH-binding)